MSFMFYKIKCYLFKVFLFKVQRNPGDGIITKHDTFISERKNAQSIEQVAD